MKKTTTKTLSLALALIIILGISATPASAASNLSANPTASTVYVNGAAKAFEAYIINGNNYFKLRDLAYVLNGSAKQFEVGYDNATKAITLTSGRPYTPDGGEMARGDGRAKTASPTASRIYLDGRELNLTVYLIGGNNFFKLRDLMEAIDVFVGYDNATKAITLDTSKSYVPEASATPTPTPTPATSGGDSGLVWPNDHWYSGLGTGYSYLAINFFSNGEFEYTVHWTTNTTGYGINTYGGILLWEEIYKGSYSASNGTLIFTFKSAQHIAYDEIGDSREIPLPANRSISYRLWEDRYEDRDNWGTITETRVYHKLDLNGPLPGANELYFADGYTLYLKEENDNHGTILDTGGSTTTIYSWTGRWESDFEYYGTFVFTQNGNTVTGACSAGSFTGTVSGNTVTGVFTDNEYGDYEWRLTMSPDGGKFSIEEKSGSWLSKNTVAVRVG